MTSKREPLTPLQPQVLWWGRHGNYGPNYPRNRTVISCMQSLGWQVIEFHPHLSAIADLEARLHGFHDIDMVWVPCFRQRDLRAAARWAKPRGIPVIFDPLISAYDKQVFEKEKFQSNGWRARRLLNWERRLFQLADIVIADTRCHRDYFIDTLGCEPQRLKVIPVSAEEDLFYPTEKPANTVPEFLFFGTFIKLQGPTVIAEASTCYAGPPIQLTFLGDGPERATCEEICRANPNAKVKVLFEDWMPFEELPGRIHQADVCLGVFGSGDKARRVIPNKVYQALACGKPVITRKGDAYPELNPTEKSLVFIEEANPSALAREMAELVRNLATPEDAYCIYQRHFSNSSIKQALQTILNTVSKSY